MAVQTYVTEPGYGFLSIFEGAALGTVVGWWLEAHHHPLSVFVGGGLAVTMLYAGMVSCCRRAALAAPLVLIGVAVWALLGWFAGDFAYAWVGGPLSRVPMLSQALAWKAIGAGILGIMALTDKGNLLFADPR